MDELIKRFNQDEKAIIKFLETNPLIDNDGVVIDKLDLLQFKKYASKRVNIDETFTKDKIDKMPYSSLKKNWLTNLLKQHLEEYGNDPKMAFKGEALEMLYKKAPHPINKVTRKEGGNKIELNNKLLDGDAGVNQYFLVEVRKEIDNKTGKEKTIRKYSTPNFLDCIERLALNLPIHDEDRNCEYITLSPGDLVYVPEVDEKINFIDWTDKKRITERVYIMKSSSESKCYFLPAYISSLIIQYDAKLKKGEFESTNKSERTKDTNQLIKQNFIKLKIDRLGNINALNVNKSYQIDEGFSNIVSEPIVACGHINKISFLKSFEEMNEADAKEMAALTPEQHLANATKLTQELYKGELIKPMDKKINFK